MSGTTRRLVGALLFMPIIALVAAHSLPRNGC